MDTRADDLGGDGELPQPGTEEPKEGSEGDDVDGPGNVSVDEPTAPALEDDDLSSTTPDGDGDDGEDDEDSSSDDDESSTDGD
jgi:hypothetical protein